VHTRPTDLRKSFDGLCGLVRQDFGRDPLDGSLFLFLNRRRDRLKLLYWDRDGLALWYKRLEQGTFEALAAADGTAASVEIDATALTLLLGGVSLASAQRRKRYRRAS
jgi:predicted ATP-grasp superfamily ATP-dependent carboligase